MIVEGRTDKRYFAKLQQALPEGVAVRVVRRDQLRDLLREVGLPES